MSKWKDQKAKEAETPVQEEPQGLDEFEQSMSESIGELQNAFREKIVKEDKRVVDVVNCDYYFVVCFSNRDQLFEFCDSVGLNPNEIYIDGRQFAKKINRALKTPDTQFPKTQPFNKDYVKRAREK